MPRDCSLTDFARTDGAADGSNDAVPDGTDDPTADGSNDAVGARASTDDGEGAEGERDGPTPARSTYEWTPDGATCAACGERTTRRWRLDGEMVCPDCKTW